MNRHTNRKLAALGPTIPLIASMLLGGCSSGGSLTCSDYAAKSFTDQTSAVADLLRDHGLAPQDIGNVQGATRAITSYCRPSALQHGKALAHANKPIEDAVDWHANDWSTK